MNAYAVRAEELLDDAQKYATQMAIQQQQVIVLAALTNAVLAVAKVLHQERTA